MEEKALTIDEVQNLSGSVLLEFGSRSCGICLGAQSGILNALSRFPQVTHIKIEDGPGKRLGRHFKVKLWPTLVLLKDGTEVAKVVRPNSEAAVSELLSK